MKVGDMVKIKDRGLSLAAAKKFLGHIGVVISIDDIGREPCSSRAVRDVLVMINGKVERFVPRYVEVISESR